MQETVYTVADYLQSANRSLNYWNNQLEKLNNNTLEYDGTIPDTSHNTLIQSKAKLYKDVVDWLENLNQDEVMGDNVGLTKLGYEYYKRVNG